MPELLAPWYLIATAAAALPVIIHLLHRHKPKPLLFSTLRFLREAIVKTQRARKLTRILTMLLRILILLLLALAFARPKIARHQLLAAGDRRTAVVVLDASASMQARDRDKTLFSAARDRALKLLDTFTKNDRVGLVLAGLPEPRVVFPPNSEPDALFAALRDAKPGFGSVNLPQLLLGLIQDFPEGPDKSGLEIHVFSDCQSTDWPAADLKPLAEALDRNNMLLFLNQTQAGNLPNAGIGKLSVSPPAVFGAGPLEVQATLQATPDFAGGDTVLLQVAGREQDRQTLPDVAGQTVPVSLKGLVEAGTDSVTGRLEIGNDAYPLDNVCHFSLPRIDAVPVLLVEPGSGTGGDNAATLFIHMALQPGGKTRSVFVPARQDWNTFAARDPHGAKAVYLCNPPALDNAIVLKLETFLRNGGTVLLFPGDNRVLEQALPNLPGLAGIKAELKSTPEAAALPILAGATPGNLEKRISVILGGKTTINVRKRLVFSQIPTGVERFFEFPDGAPFMLQVPVGQGTLWVMALSADRDGSDWPVTPFFVIQQQELLRQAAGRSAPTLFTAVGDTLALDWAEDTLDADFRLAAPNGTEKTVAAKRRKSTEAFLIRGFNEPGIHVLKKGDTQRLVAVNVPAAENELVSQPAGELATAMAPAMVLPSADLKEQQEALAKARRGSPLWPFLLAAAFLLALIESLAANPRALRTRLRAGLNRVMSPALQGSGGGA